MPSHPKSERENITLRMHPVVKQNAQIQAIREKRDLSDLVEDALELYFKSLAIAIVK